MAFVLGVGVACGEHLEDSADASPAGGRQDVTFSTLDGKRLTGFVTTSALSPEGSPGVLLIHQFQRDDTQWGALPEALAGAGYRVLAFNLRGHGDSEPYDGNLVDLLTDPDAAPADMDAALDYLTGPASADQSHIAVVGTSVGANLAVSAAIRDLATTYVSLSARQAPAEGFGGAAAQGMSSVFYLASENDTGGQAGDAQAMFDATADPRKLQIYAGTADHGIAILDNQSGAQELVLDWLATNL